LLVRSFEIRSIVAEIEMRSRPPGIDGHPRQSEIVDGEINRKSDQLVEEKMGQSHDWHILHIIAKLRMGRMGFFVSLFKIGNKSNVFVEIVGVFVMR